MDKTTQISERGIKSGSVLMLTEKTRQANRLSAAENKARREANGDSQHNIWLSRAYADLLTTLAKDKRYGTKQAVVEAALDTLLSVMAVPNTVQSTPKPAPNPKTPERNSPD